MNDSGIEADFKEYLEITNPKLKDKVNDLYIKSTKGNGKIFKKVYKLGKLYEKTRLKSPIYGLNSLNKEKLYKYIKENQYGFVITTHLFAGQALTAIKKDHHIRFMQIATDYVSIPFWEETNPDYFIIPSEELEYDFINKGIPKDKLLPYGIPVKKSFRTRTNIIEIQNKLKIESNKKYVLILNGSMGFGNVIDLTKRLLENIQNVVFIVSCGNNNNLFNYLTDKYKANNNIIALPYVDNLNEYMQISEIVLTKPGGLTTTEVATMRKPLIHIMPIPGCENYNADFFEKKDMAIKCNNIEQVVENTKKLLENKELQVELINNQIKYIKRDTCEKILEIVRKELNRGNN